MGYHPAVGEADSDVRMRYRYHAKMEFVRSQARQMLLRRARKAIIIVPDMVLGTWSAFRTGMLGWLLVEGVFLLLGSIFGKLLGTKSILAILRFRRQ